MTLTTLRRVDRTLSMCALLAWGAVLGRQVPQTGGAVRRTYWPVSIDSLALRGTPHTHASLTGRVTLVRHEADGDMHIKLVGRTGFAVLEIIPSLPMVAPTVGLRIRAFGITRRDLEHGWWELHPLERWERVP